MNTKRVLCIIMTTTLMHWNCASDDNKEADNKDKGIMADYSYYVDHLTLKVPATITKNKYFYFSNDMVKDLFTLTIEPGLVKNSNSLFQIKTAIGEVIYEQKFGTFYFMRYASEPEILPQNLSKEAYETYLSDYIKHLNNKYLGQYFNKEVNTFFNATSKIERSEVLFMAGEEDLENNEAYEEAMADSSTILFDIISFNSDEGGEIIFYSKNKQKVVVIDGHD
jgi:hypothetical protein